jgi:hypothetical protein
MPDLRAALGAGPPTGTVQVTVFLPSVDRDERPIPQARWVDDCLAVLGRLFRGATAFPPGRGVWRDDDQGGRLVYDDTVLVTSYVDPTALTDDAVAGLRSFLHRLGREGRQGEVGVVIGGSYYGIQEYDSL